MARIDDQLTPVTPAQVLEALAGAWRQQFGSEPHRTSLLVLVSQWALETGRGHAMHCFNLGNVKSNGTAGDWCFFRCNEVLKGKVVWFDPDAPECRFRAFATLEDGARDYLTTLHHRFQSAWPAVVAGDPAAFSRALKLARYYTADEAQYTKSVVSLFNEFSRTISDAREPAAGAGGPSLPDLYSTRGVQLVLAELGFSPGAIDGIDGANTTAALRAFQVVHGLVADGILGRLTRAALAKAWTERGAAAPN